MAVPMKNGGIKSSKVILYVVLSGITTGIGALIRKLNWANFVYHNIIMFSICGRSDALYSNGRANSRGKWII